MGPTSGPIGRTKRRTGLQLPKSRSIPRGNVVRPVLHERTPGLEHVVAPVRLFCGCARLVRQGSFSCRDFLIEVVLYPIHKRASETMRHDGTTGTIRELEAMQDLRYVTGMQNARSPSADPVPENQRTRRIRVTSIRKNAQGLTGQWHTVLSPFLHTMLGNGPERGLKIELRPPCLRSLTKADRCEHNEGDRQLDHVRHGRSLKRRQRRPNLAVRQARLGLRPGPDLRKPVDNLLGRIVGAVLIADGPPQNVNQLMPQPET